MRTVSGCRSVLCWCVGQTASARCQHPGPALQQPRRVSEQSPQLLALGGTVLRCVLHSFTGSPAGSAPGTCCNKLLTNACFVGSSPFLVLIPYSPCASWDHLPNKLDANPWTALGVTEPTTYVLSPLSFLSALTIFLPSRLPPSFLFSFVFVVQSAGLFSDWRCEL